MNRSGLGYLALAMVLVGVVIAWPKFANRGKPEDSKYGGSEERDSASGSAGLGNSDATGESIPARHRPESPDPIQTLERRVTDLKQRVEEQEGLVEEARTALTDIIKSSGLTYRGAEPVNDDSKGEDPEVESFETAKSLFEARQKVLEQLKIGLIGAEMQLMTLRSGS